MRRRTMVVAAAVIAVLVGVALWFVTAANAARAGELFEASSPASGRTAQVLLPGDRAVDITVGEPTRSIDGSEQSGYPVDDERAGWGNRFVPVSWVVTARNFSGSVLPRLTLVSDDHRYVLPMADADPRLLAGSRSFFVAVQGKADDLTVEVEYDGLVQVVDVEEGDVDAGVAAPLYESPGRIAQLEQRVCAFTSAKGARRHDEFSCTISTVLATPYLPELGWVEDEGDSWLELTVLDRFPTTLETHGEDGDWGHYQLSAKRSIALAGEQPVAVLRPERGSGYVRASYVFVLGPDPAELVLTRTYLGTLISGEGSPAKVRVSGSLETMTPSRS